MKPRHWLYTIPLRLRSLLRHDEVEQELDEELRYHVEQKTEEFAALGMTREEARRAAMREFGGVEQSKENCRDVRRVNLIEDLWQDARFGARMLWKSRGFTIVAVLTLGLGIGATTAIFSVVNGVLLRSLPYSKPEELVMATGYYPRGAFAAMREQAQTMELAAYVESANFNLIGQGSPVRLEGSFVSAELFSVLGAQPELGRTFLRGEDAAGQDNFVILSHTLWQRLFAGDPAVVGKFVALEGVSREVLGVMPAEFRFPSAKTEMWVPLHNDPKNTRAYWGGDYMPVIGRLRPDADMARARREIGILQSRMPALFPWAMPANWNAGVSVVPLQSGMVADVKARLLLLLGAVAAVLLIACANVANLTLTRAAAREREMAVRAGLGANRHRMVRQLLTESLVLAFAGSALGLILASKGVTILKSVLPADFPRMEDVAVDWHVLAFAAGLAVLTSIVFGLFPALQISRRALAESMKSGGKGTAGGVSEGLRGALAAGEVGLAVLLVISAGLLIRSFLAMSHADLGFRPERVLTARINPNEPFCSEAARCIAFYRALLERAQAIPGVSEAALVNTLPLDGRVSKRALSLEGYEVAPGTPMPLFWLDAVTADYFRVMKIPIVGGRAPQEAETDGNPAVVLVSEASAKTYWPGQNAVGKHVRLAGDKDWREVIGVVADVKAFDVRRSVPEWINGTVYVPYGRRATRENGTLPAEMTLTLRATVDEHQLQSEMRRIVASLNGETSVSEVHTMADVVGESQATPRSTMVLLGTFASLALVLGIIGVYGVVSFLVSKRTREIGIRMAMGAQKRDVLGLVMKEGARFAFAGIGLGVSCAFATTKLLASELYGVGTMDPFTFVVVPMILAVVALLACYIPARRAMRVDPMVALRYE